MKRVIDWEDLMNRLGDEELIKEIVPEFLNNNTDYLDAISKAIDNHDPKEVENNAHALKGSSASIGATELSTLAKALEVMAKDLSLDDAESLLEKVREQYQAVIDLLRKPNWDEIAKEASGYPQSDESSLK